MVIKNRNGPDMKNPEKLFAALSKRVPCGKYYEFATYLGLKYNSTCEVLKRHRDNFTDATRENLGTWEDMGAAATKSGLKKALVDAEIGSLCEIVDTYFDQVASNTREAETRDQLGASPSSSTSQIPAVVQKNMTINISGSAPGSTIAGGIVNIGNRANTDEDHAPVPTKLSKPESALGEKGQDRKTSEDEESSDEEKHGSSTNSTSSNSAPEMKTKSKKPRGKKRPADDKSPGRISKQKKVKGASSSINTSGASTGSAATAGTLNETGETGNEEGTSPAVSGKPCQNPDLPRSSFKRHKLKKPNRNDLPFPEPEMVYDLWKSKEKGCALVLNNVTVVGAKEKRYWSHIDVTHMRELFERLGYKLPFEIMECQDLSKAAMLNKMKELASVANKSKNVNSVAVYIGSHGNDDGPLGTNREVLNLRDIFNVFNNVLPGKPKIIIIDACWGTEWTEIKTRTNTAEPVPENADIILVCSTSLGKVSLSYDDTGSWFVEDLCNVCYDSTRDLEDLDTIIMRVTQMMAKRLAVKERNRDTLYTQCPTIIKQGVSKKLYFF